MIKTKEKRGHQNPTTPEFYEDYIKAVVPKIIEHFESTKDDEWMVGITSSGDNLEKVCVVNHIIRALGKRIDLDIFCSQTGWNYFFMFQVNDGNTKFFKGDTPKQRCLSLFKTLLSHPHNTRLYGLAYFEGYSKGFEDAEKHNKEKNEKNK